MGPELPEAFSNMASLTGDLNPLKPLNPKLETPYWELKASYTSSLRPHTLVAEGLIQQ